MGGPGFYAREGNVSVLNSQLKGEGNIFLC